MKNQNASPKQTRTAMVEALETWPDGAVLVTVNRDKTGATENHALLSYDVDGHESRTVQRVLEQLMERNPAAAKRAIGTVYRGADR